MSTRISVRNLPSNTTDQQLSELFGRFGTVKWSNLVTDEATGRSRDFGFLEMSCGASEAVKALDGKEIGDRRLAVTWAIPSCHSAIRRQRSPKRVRQYRLISSLQRPATLSV